MREHEGGVEIGEQEGRKVAQMTTQLQGNKPGAFTNTRHSEAGTGLGEQVGLSHSLSPLSPCLASLALLRTNWPVV